VWLAAVSVVVFVVVAAAANAAAAVPVRCAVVAAKVATTADDVRRGQRDGRGPFVRVARRRSRPAPGGLESRRVFAGQAGQTKRVLA